MSASRLGKEAERRVRLDLESNGFRIMAAHLSRGPADFLASKPDQTLAVQVKRSLRSGGGIGVEAWNELIDWSTDFNAIPVVAIAFPRTPIRYLEIVDRKDGSCRRQPWRALLVDFAAAAS